MPKHPVPPRERLVQGIRAHVGPHVLHEKKLKVTLYWEISDPREVQILRNCAIICVILKKIFK